MKETAIAVAALSITLGIISYPLFETFRVRIAPAYDIQTRMKTINEAAAILRVPADESKTFHQVLTARAGGLNFLPPRLETASLLGLSWFTPEDELIRKALVV